MELSRLNSKKYQAVLQFKKQLNRSPDFASTPTISEEEIFYNREINEYGDTVVKSLKISPREFSANEVQSMVIQYRDGKSTNKLATEFGCSKNTISKILRQQGINVTKCKARRKIDEKQAIEMYENMHTSQEIAQIFGVHPQVVIDCLRENGVKIRSRWDYT